MLFSYYNPLLSLGEEALGRELRDAGIDGVLYDACAGKDFVRALCEAMPRRRSFNGGSARLRAFPTNALRTAAAEEAMPTSEPTLHRSQRSNTTIDLAGKYFLKFFRRVEAGPNPDLEVERFLNEKNFPHVPRIAGWLDFEPANAERLTAAVLTEFLPNTKTCWDFAVDALGRYFERLGLALEHLTAAAQADAESFHEVMI